MRTFIDIVEYIGAKLIAEYPKLDQTKRGAQKRTNKRMEFVNVARDAVNQNGKMQRLKKAGETRNYMEDIEDFVPLLERENFKNELEVSCCYMLLQ
jgi:hypothetical protein